MRQTYFKDMLDYVSQGLANKEKGADKVFQKYFEDCHQFLFYVSEDKEPVKILEVHSEPLDLPYPCIHIEVPNMYISVPHHSEVEKVYVCSFIATEISPKEYHFLAYLIVNGKKHIIEVTKERDAGAWGDFNAFLKFYLDRLSKEKIGVESPSMKVKIGGGSSKRFYKPSAITHVSPKKYTDSVTTTIGGKMIDWTHRWEVRGHWRTVQGIGKDRSGEYVVQGFTWISNFVKGPENAPIIKKSYIIN